MRVFDRNTQLHTVHTTVGVLASLLRAVVQARLQHTLASAAYTRNEVLHCGHTRSTLLSV